MDYKEAERCSWEDDIYFKFTFCVSAFNRLISLFWTIAGQDTTKNIFSEVWPADIGAVGWAVISDRIRNALLGLVDLKQSAEMKEAGHSSPCNGVCCHLSSPAKL